MVAQPLGRDDRQRADSGRLHRDPDLHDPEPLRVEAQLQGRAPGHALCRRRPGLQFDASHHGDGGAVLPVSGQRLRPQRRFDQLRAGERPARHEHEPQQRPVHLDADRDQPGPGQRGRGGLRPARRPYHPGLHHRRQRRQLAAGLRHPGEPVPGPGRPDAPDHRDRHRPAGSAAHLLGRQPAAGRPVRHQHPNPDLAPRCRPGRDLLERDLLRQRWPRPGQRIHHGAHRGDAAAPDLDPAAGPHRP